LSLNLCWMDFLSTTTGKFQIELVVELTGRHGSYRFQSNLQTSSCSCLMRSPANYVMMWFWWHRSKVRPAFVFKYCLNWNWWPVDVRIAILTWFSLMYTRCNLKWNITLEWFVPPSGTQKARAHVAGYSMPALRFISWSSPCPRKNSENVHANRPRLLPSRFFWYNFFNFIPLL
jgi:hypothetical protein